MSKRARVPAPFRRLQPSVIRGLGPRLFLVASAATALLLIGGSSYVLSHVTGPGPTAQPQTKLTQPAPEDAKVLGATTTTSDSDTGGATSPASSSPSTGAASTAATAPSTGGPQSTAQICALTCIPGMHVPMPQPAPSFELIADTSSAHKSLLDISLPFHVVRHGNLDAPIQPGAVSLRIGGSPTSLLRVQSARMTDSDHGVIAILNLGLPLSTPIDGQFSAQSDGLSVSTSFTF